MIDPLLLADEVERLRRELAGLSRQIANMPVRECDASGIADHFQIVRGAATAAVDVADEAFQIEGIAAYEQFAATPAYPLWVKAPADGVTLAEGDSVWAIWRENVLTFDPGGGDVQVDWLMFEPGSSNTPPLRRFVLVENKVIGATSATVKWLDHAGTAVGGDVTIYDPAGIFSGRAADGLYTGSVGFEGYALLRSDLAESEPGEPRWEIVVMDQLAEYIKGQLVAKTTYPSAENTIWEVRFSDIVTKGVLSDPWGWSNIAPCDTSIDPDITDVGFHDDPDVYKVFGKAPYEADGEIVHPQDLIFRLTDPDGEPPIYRVCDPPVQVFEVALTEAIAASGWVAATSKKTPVSKTEAVFYLHPDDDGTDTITADVTLIFTSNLKVSVDAAATGKFKRGIVIGGKLVQVQCEEEDLPEDWDE